MSLFTDGTWLTSADLDVVDGEFTEIATANNVIVNNSAGSQLTYSMLEAGQFLEGKFQNFSGYLVGLGASANAVAAVQNVLSTAINRPRAMLHQVAVTEPDPNRTAVKSWIRYFALHIFYESLFSRFSVDRYEKKMLRYEKAKFKAWENLQRNGLPIVLNPLSCPGAIFDYGAGTFGVSNVTTVSTGTETGGSFDVSISWCSLPLYTSYSNQGNAESGPSPVVNLLVAANNVLKVSISGLKVPDGTMANALGSALGIFSPLAATHWNVYVGATGGPRYLQNSSPIAVTTTTYQLAGDPVLSGSAQNAGQCSNYAYSMPDIVWRA